MDDETLFAQAILGKQAELFFESDLGRYVIGCAMYEEKQALKELREVNPHDAVKVSELQIKIKVATSAIKWLNEAIITGKQAKDTLETREE